MVAFDHRVVHGVLQLSLIISLLEHFTDVVMHLWNHKEIESGESTRHEGDICDLNFDVSLRQMVLGVFTYCIDDVSDQWLQLFPHLAVLLSDQPEIVEQGREVSQGEIFVASYRFFPVHKLLQDLFQRTLVKECCLDWLLLGVE